MSKLPRPHAPHAAAPRRRATLALLGSALGAGLSASPDARAQGSYPDKPIRLFVGYPPGGGTDFVARLVAAKLGEVLGQPVNVMNVPGATGAIAVERVVNSPADGYTLLVISAADTILPALRAKQPFDFGKDLAPVAPAVRGALALVVNPKLPARNVRELIALAKSQPGKLNYSSPGIGNSQHLAGEFFNQLAGVNIVHVPFKGGADAMNATIAGETHVSFASLAPALPLVEAGRLRMLAVTPGTRSASLPDVPTLAEAGVPGYNRATWFGVAAPAATPPDILQRLNAAIARAMQSPGTRETLLKQGLEPDNASLSAYASFVRNELAANAKIVRDLGLKPQ